MLVLAPALRRRGHADRERLLRSHKLSENVFHERFRFVEIYGPADSEDPIVEETVRARVPIRIADALPGRRTEVIWHRVEHAPVPRSLFGGLGQLGRYSRRDETK